MVPEAGIEPARLEKRGILKAVSAVNGATISLIYTAFKSVRVTPLFAFLGCIPPSLRLDSHAPRFINLALLGFQAPGSIGIQ